MRKIPSSELLHNGFADVFDTYKNTLSLPIEKFVSSFPRVGDKIPLRTGISGRIYYTSVLSSLTDEYTEDTILKTADVANVFETDILHNEIFQIMYGTTTTYYETYNNLVSMVVGVGGSIFAGNKEIIEIMFIVMSFMFCFVTHFHQHQLVHNNNDVSEKLGGFIDIKQIKQNTRMFMLVLFMVLSRNVNSAS